MTQEEQVLQIVKLRLSLADDKNDAIVLSYIVEIGHRIRHYCNITGIPDALLYVWASMVVDALRVDLPNVDEIADSIGVSAGANVKVGDTSVSGGSGSGGGLTNTAKSVIDKIVFDYRADLHRYRRLVW
ncbi:hypothetical protein [Brevibacillus massiliensis]|uniref:hypothetical protein n=1 Tax=Brevibacillus massiliensis TaxID=1118054 RepID=UPI000361A72C|nr:hypothetical protein [Brevibacillus massiliensis]